MNAENRKKKFLASIRINKHNGVFIILFLVLLASWIYQPEFLNVNNVFNMLRQSAALGILTAGQLFVIVGGGVDLSVAATMQFGVIIFTYFGNLLGGWGIVLGLALALLFGALVGTVNGVIVSRFGVQPFLATLFMSSILTGVRMIVNGIKPAGDIADAIRFIGRDTTGPVPNAVILMVIVFILCFFLLNKSAYGRKLVAVGTNGTAARFSGINGGMVTIMSYIICSILSIISVVVLAGYIGYADQWIGNGYDTNSLVAAVIGGNYLGGGRGSLGGVIGGVLITTLVLNVVLLFGLTAEWQHVVKGLILIIALLIGSLSTREKKSKRGIKQKAVSV